MPTRSKYLASKVKYSDQPWMTQEQRDTADTGQPHLTEFEVAEILDGKRPAPGGSKLADKSFVEYLRTKEDPAAAASESLRSDGFNVTPKREVAKQVIEGNRDPDEVPGLSEKLKAPAQGKDAKEGETVIDYLRRSRREFPGGSDTLNRMSEDTIQSLIEQGPDKPKTGPVGPDGPSGPKTGPLRMLAPVASSTILGALGQTQSEPAPTSTPGGTFTPGPTQGPVPQAPWKPSTVPVDPGGEAPYDHSFFTSEAGGIDFAGRGAASPWSPPTQTPLPEMPVTDADPLDPAPPPSQVAPPVDDPQQTLLAALRAGGAPEAPLPPVGVAGVPSDLLKQQAAAAKEAAAASDEAAAAVRSSAEQANAATLEAQQGYMGAMSEMSEQAALAAKARVNSLQQAERAQGAFQATLAEARRAASVELDPGRFWARQSDGQKFMAVLAGALFGFSGKGMEWLAHIKSLVDQDLKAQESDREMKVRGLEGEGKGHLAMRDFAMQKGATEAEAYLIQKAAKYEQAQAWLHKAQLSTSNAQAQANAAKAIAALEQEKLQVQTQLVSTAQARADSMNAAAFRNRELQLRERDSLRDYQAKLMAATTKGQKGEPIPGTVVNEYSQDLANVRKLIQLAQLADIPDLSARVGQAAKSAVDLEGKGAGARENAYKSLALEVGKMYAGGALQSHEIALLKEMGIDPGKGIPVVKNAGPGIREVAGSYMRRLKDRLLTLSAQYDPAVVERLAQQVSQLEQEAAGTPAAPSYMTEAK